MSAAGPTNTAFTPPCQPVSDRWCRVRYCAHCSPFDVLEARWSDGVERKVRQRHCCNESVVGACSGLCPMAVLPFLPRHPTFGYQHSSWHPRLPR